MQTSRFQIGIIATLAIALGFSLASSEAIGYPAGGAVSLGANPLWSVAGEGDGSLPSAPSDQDMIITDVVTFGYNSRFSILLADGTVVAYLNASATTYHSVFESGIKIPAGSTASIDFEGGTASLYTRHTISGYYAQP